MKCGGQVKVRGERVWCTPNQRKMTPESDRKGTQLLQKKRTESKKLHLFHHINRGRNKRKEEGRRRGRDGESISRKRGQQSVRGRGDADT